MAQPASNFPTGMPGEPRSSVPYATSGKAQPRSPHGPKKIKVKAHTRVVQNQHHIDAVARRDAKLHANAMGRYNAAHPTSSSAPAGGLDTATKNLLDAAVRLKFGGQEQGYNQQLQANARFQSGVPAWYAQAMNEIKGIGATSAAQNAQTLQNVQAYNSPVAQTGTPDAVQAAAARNSLNSQYGTMLGRDSQANQDFLSRLQGGMVVQQGNTLNAANRDAQTIRQNQTALQGQKGDFKTTFLADQRAAQAKSILDQGKLQATLSIAAGKNDLAQQQLKVAQTLAQNTIDNTTADNAIAQGNLDLATTDPSRAKTQADLDFFNKHGYYPSTGDPAKKGGGGGNSLYSKSKIQGFRANWDYAQATAKQLKDAGTYIPKSGPNKGKVQNITTDTAYSALLNATKDPDIAKAAAYLAFGKPVPPELLHTLAVKGIHPPRPKVGRVKGGGPYGTGRMGR